MKTLIILRRFSSTLLGLILFILAFSNTWAQTAQVKNYTMSSFSSAYTPISGGTLIGSGDDNTYSFTLPFDFNYDSVLYTSGSAIYVNTNGIVKLGSTIYCCEYSNYMGTTSYPTQMGIFQADQYVNTGIYYQTTGSAPNRKLTIEFVNLRGYSGNGAVTSMEAVLYESTNIIEYWYKDWSFNEANYQSAGVGLNGNGSGNWLIFQGSSTSTPSSNARFIPPIPLPNVQLSVSPTAIDYGFGLTGQIVDRQVTVTHAGTQGTLTISSATLSGAPDFSIVGSLPPPLLPGQNANITVRFVAQLDGVRTGTLTIVSNGRDSGKQSVSLTAKGVAPNISVDSTTMFKKTRTRLGDTLTQWIHITALGQASLFIFSYPITGIDADQYFISHFPSNPMAPGTTDSLQVTYIPTREGLRSATLTINNNSFNNPALAITLKGTGILPHIVVTPTLLLFDSTREGDTVCTNISISNTGSDTLKIYSNYLSSNDGDFHYTPLAPIDVNIPPDVTKTVGVCFIPIQQGERQARLFLKTNIIPTYETPRRDTASTLTVDIRGTGVPFGFFANAFSGPPYTDSALVGVQVCRTDSLFNNGDADINVTGLTITGAQFTYSGLPAFPFVLKARSFKTFTICGTPDQQGLLSGSAMFTGRTSGSNISSIVGLSIYGFKACVGASPISLFDGLVLPNNGSDSTICDTVTNCGDITAIYHASISGTASADYTVTPSVTAAVPPMGTTVFCVKYKPGTVGSSTAKLDVAADDHSASTSILLNGSDGCAIVTPTADAVLPTGVLATSTFNVTINNTGTFQWTANQGSVAPGDGVFSILSLDQPSAPAANGAIVVKMQFAPKVLGNASAILTFPNAGPCENAPISVTLNGQGVVNSVKDQSADGFSLDQSYPNPTQGVASFNYTTPKESEVRIAIADMTGRIVRTLITGRVSEGLHTVNFDVRDLSSGTYIYLLESGSTRLVRQFILAK